MLAAIGLSDVDRLLRDREGDRPANGHVERGAPDQIESRPATTDSPQLEVWYYNQPYRRFVFADREGFGRYTLVSPSIE